MSKITREDLRAILTFALHTAKVDHDFAQSEKAVIKKYLDLIHLSHEERQTMSHQNRSLSEMLDQLSSTDAKTLLVKTICAVAHSDGVMVDSETDFVKRVNKQLQTGMTLLPQDRWGEYETEVMQALKQLS